MHSTNVRQIKAALVEQAFLGSTRVSCPIGPIVAVRRRKGQLLVMIRGWGRWYPVDSVCIERMVVERHDRDALASVPLMADLLASQPCCLRTPAPPAGDCRQNRRRRLSSRGSR